MIRAKFILVNLNFKHFTQNIQYNEIIRITTMYFIVIFESLNYQSHLVTKYNFVSKYYYIIKGIMCFLSLYQLDINKNTILSIFLYIELEFSCIKNKFEFVTRWLWQFKDTKNTIKYSLMSLLSSL